MEMDVRDKEKRVNIWLTHAESQDPELMESLKAVYKEYKAKKYLVAVFESGTEDLQGLTRELLRYNRVRLRELEDKKQKTHDYARKKRGGSAEKRSLFQCDFYNSEIES